MTIKKWEDASNKIAQSFIFRHFGRTADWYWIGEDIGGVVSVADYFFGLQDIVHYTRCRYTSEQMFEYYQYALDLSMKNKTPINIENWLKLKV